MAKKRKNENEKIVDAFEEAANAAGDGMSARDAMIKLEGTLLGISPEEAAARHDASEQSLREAEAERRLKYAEANVPTKIDPRLFPFQEHFGNDMFPNYISADFNDMYAFFKANDPKATYDATVELNDVEFDPFSYRELSPINNVLIPPDRLTELEVSTTQIKQIVEDAGGKIARGPDGSYFYISVIGANAELLRKLADLDCVSGISLRGDPSNLRAEREQQRRQREQAQMDELRAEIDGREAKQTSDEPFP